MGRAASPGAVWIARQLRQVNPAWGIVSSDLDMLAREWCSPHTRTAIQRLLYALPGADLPALPALTQLVQALRASCYERGEYSGYEIDYSTYVTSGSLMTLVRRNVRQQARAASYAWQRPARRAPGDGVSVDPTGGTDRMYSRHQDRIVVADEAHAQGAMGLGGTRWSFGGEGSLSHRAQLGGQAPPVAGEGLQLRERSHCLAWFSPPAPSSRSSIRR